MPQRFTQVDAFTDRPFAGNPAAVCILPGPADDRWMQRVASEMNLAETAFLTREDDAFRLRWFTPTVEADLCGHATLASAHVLWEEGVLRPEETAQFDTRSGRLTAARHGDLIQLDFPALPVEACEPPDALRDAHLGGFASWAAIRLTIWSRWSRRSRCGRSRRICGRWRGCPHAG